MKSTHVFVAAISLALLAIPVHAADGPRVAGAAPAQTAAATVHLGVGKILGIDTAQRVLTIAHQDMPSMGMPAMVMDFPLHPSTDASLLSAGQVIAFVLAPHAGGVAMTAVQAVAMDSASNSTDMIAKCQKIMARK